MKELSQEMLVDLSQKVESFIMLELGETVPFIAIFYTQEDNIGLFTNRRNDGELIAALEEVLKVVKSRASKWRNL